ncbi:MAG: sigma-54-dependent transcriptional regulator [Planctomycetota bacterium]
MRILLVDDHPEVAESLASLLCELGHECRCAAGGAQALAQLARAPHDLVLTDLRMPEMDGASLLAHVQRAWPQVPVAVMTAFGERYTAVDLMRRGAVDYFHKPIDVREVLALLERLNGASDDVVDPLLGQELADGLLVHSAALAAVIRRCDKVHAMPETPVLIQGATGTGKELIARRIHHGGDPDGEHGPFVALNCAAISPSLFESELFGYAAGAFTGARNEGQPGKLALAAGGTVFLDEVGELPADQQAKLLRVLETRRWYPVGGNREQQLHARILCATNLALEQAVHDGEFREDLYYRLKVVRLQLPSLVDHPGSVERLAPAILERLRRRIPHAYSGIAPAAMARLEAHAWPGNIRELVHLLEALCIEAEGEMLAASVLDQHLAAEAPRGVTSSFRRQRVQVVASEGGLVQAPTAADLPDDGFDLDRWHGAVIAAALEKCGHSPVRTAKYLGISRKVLYTLRKRYGLMPEES